MVSTRTLAKIAGWGGIGLITSAMLMRNSIIDRIRRQEYYQDALKILRAHPGAVTLLGEPIRDLKFKLENKENFCDGKNAHFQVKIKGPKDKGMMYFWAVSNEGKWNVTRVELELNDRPDKRLLVKRENVTTES